MSLRHGQYVGNGDIHPCLCSQRHRCVLHQRCVQRIIELVEFDDHSLAAGNLQQRLGPRTAEGDTRLHQPLNVCGDGRLRLHVFDRRTQLPQISQLRIRPQVTRNVLLRRHGNSEGAKAIIARKQQHFENRQPRGSVDVANDAFTPTIGTRIVNGTRGTVPLASGKRLTGHQRQVFAQRKVPPMFVIGERGAIGHQLGEPQGSHQHGLRRIHERPDIELVLRNVSVWIDTCGTHLDFAPDG